MRRILLFMLLLCVSLPAIAAENEFRLGMIATNRYDDNITGVSQGKRDAFVFQVGPKIRFDSAASRYKAGFNYIPRFTHYTDGRDDDHTHTFGAHLDYRPTQRLSFAARDSLTLEFDADRDNFGNDAVNDLDDDGEKKTFRNRLNADVRYALTPRLSLASNYGYLAVLRDDRDLTNSSQMSGRVQTDYVVGPQDSVGVGVLARYQVVEGSGTDGDMVSNFEGFFLSWNHRFATTLGLSATGGPTWVTSNRDGDQMSATTDLEYFANVGINAKFDRSAVSIAYQRSSSETSRNSTAFVADIVSVRANWAASRKLDVAITGSWIQNTAVLKHEVGNFENEVTQWQSVATISYKLTLELVGRFVFDYLRQESTDPIGNTRTSDRMRFTIRFDYNARTLRF